MISHNFNQINPFEVFDYTDLEKGKGYKVGDLGAARGMGLFRLVESYEDLYRGMIVKLKSRFSIDAVSTVVSLTSTTAVDAGEFLYAADCGADVAAERLKGNLAFFDDNGSGGALASGNDLGCAEWVKSQNGSGEKGALENGSALYLGLRRALFKPGVPEVEDSTEEGFDATDAGDITLWDRNYVEKCAADTLTQVVEGVAPRDVDVSDKPIFWLQVQGICPVLAVTADGGNSYKLSGGGTTAGYATEIGAAETYDDANAFAQILQVAPAASKFCIAKINCGL